MADLRPDRAAGSASEDYSNEQSPTIQEDRVNTYWKKNIGIMMVLLSIWFLCSFGAGILFRPMLDNFSLGGAPLGFWFAQQGSIYIFLGLVVVYGVLMHRLEVQYDVEDDED